VASHPANTITQAIVYSMSDIVLVILAVVTLGYLGSGSSRPRRTGIDDQRWSELHPDQSMAGRHTGMAVVLTGVGLSLLGDGLADILRPE